MTGLHADAYVPGLNTLRLRDGESAQPGMRCRAHNLEQTCKQQDIQKRLLAVMRQMKAEGLIRIRATVRSQTTTGWPNDP